jgi:hypothetical protein
VPAYVVEAEIELAAGCDPRAVGAAVTVELCGHWEHEGACRWPHNSEIDVGRRPALSRTIYVADTAEEPEIRARIEQALRSSADWTVAEVRTRDVATPERELAERLASGPRRTSAKT